MIFPKDVLSGETNKNLEGDRLTVAKAACPPQTPPLGHAAGRGSFFIYIDYKTPVCRNIKTIDFNLHSRLLMYAYEAD